MESLIPIISIVLFLLSTVLYTKQLVKKDKEATKLRVALINALTDLTTARIKLSSTTIEYKRLARRWNRLVDRINSKGGEEFLHSCNLFDTHVDKIEHSFNKQELRFLLMQCHPDKHKNSEVAEAVTRKLVKMKSS